MSAILQALGRDSCAECFCLFTNLERAPCPDGRLWDAKCGVGFQRACPYGKQARYDILHSFAWLVRCRAATADDGGH